MPSNKVVVLGGTFNPLSRAHGDLINSLIDQFDATKGILLPTGDDFFCSWKHFNKESILPASLRLKILEEFVKRNKKVELELVEFNGKSHKTYDSLSYLKHKYPDKEILFAFGSEKADELERWYRIDEILTNYKIILIRRNFDDIDKLLEENNFLNKYKNSFLVVNSSDALQDISSTKIRNALIKKDEEELKTLTYDYVIDILKKEKYL